MQKYIIPISTKVNEVIRVIPIFDLHLISNTFDKELFLKYVDYILKHDNVYWFCGGDISEFINFNDKRFDPKSVRADIKVSKLANLAKMEIEEFKELVSPILNSEKCLGIGEGNHDRKLASRGEGDIVKNICDEFNLRYLGYSGFLKLIFSRGASNSRRPFTIYYHHGFFGGRRGGSKVNNAEMLALKYDCNVAVTGHCHTRISTGPMDYIRFDEIQLKYGLVCGSFKTGVGIGIDSWEEMRGYEMQRYRMGSWAIDIIAYPTNDTSMMYTAVEFNPDWSTAIKKCAKRELNYGNKK